ncbi:MAG TPA: Ig-like domain-containing protein [Ohtaekwangia sp.]|nr:Ig-like domain-containing protein [Ohtaekwangia sp.]
MVSFGQVSDDVAATDEGFSVTFSVTANDTDPNGIDETTVDLDVGTVAQETQVSTAQGTFEADLSGSVTFTPATGFTGDVTLTYSVKTDLGVDAGTGLITVTVNAVVANPVAVDDYATTQQGTPVSIDIIANDTPTGNIDGASIDLNLLLPFQQTTQITLKGTFQVVSPGVVQFTPLLGLTGDATVQYRVSDTDDNESNTATITVEVIPNASPTANDDVATINENETAVVSILLNDTDDGTLDAGSVDLNPSFLGKQSSRDVTGGNFTVDASGILSFVPDAGYNGSASVTYTVQDNHNAVSNQATITITINSVNPVPVAADDVASTPENTPVDISILANDTDDTGLNANSVDLDPETAGQEITGNVTGGTFAVSAGVVTFTPSTNYNGPAVITYTVQDTEGATSNTASITITVSSVNENPVAVNDEATADENTPVNVTILSNDTDDTGLLVSSVDLDPGTAEIQTTLTVTEGLFSVNGSGILNFSPALNYHGTASITYTVNDIEGATSNIATVKITVNSINAAPVATNDAGSTNENEVLSLNILANDSDDTGLSANSVDLDPLTENRQSTMAVTGGNFSVDAAGILTFTPTLNYNGQATVTYTVNDLEGVSSNMATVTITINDVNTAPVATNDSGTTNEDTAVNIDILDNDTDDIGLDVTTVDLSTTEAGIQSVVVLSTGTFSVDATGILNYTPSPDFNGPATITYTVKDSEDAISNVATVTITVNAANDLPVAGNDAIVTDEDVTASVNVLSNDTDPDGTVNAATVDIDVNTAGIQSIRTTTAGSFSVSTSGLLAFTPAENYHGVSSIRYAVQDNLGGISNAATVTITVNNINDAPVAGDDATSTNQGVAKSINVLTNDTDDGSLDPLTVDLDPDTGGIQSSRATTAGNYSVSSSGEVTFSPVATFSGTTSITYTVSDDAGVVSNRATLSIEVIYINQNPVATNDGASTDEDVPVSLNVVTNDTDDGSINPASVDLNTTLNGVQSTNTTPGGSWTVDATGMVTFTPNLNFNGTATLTYRVNDNLGVASNPATITITVNVINDPPVAQPDVKTTNEDILTTINILANDTDVDNTILPSSVDLDPVTAGIQSSVIKTEGTWTVNAEGVVTYAPTANFFGTALLTYTVNDNVGAKSNEVAITVTVTSINDAPIALNDQPSTPQNVTVTFNVVANDIDVDGTINKGSVDLDPAVTGRQTSKSITSGAFSIDNDGNVTFVPATNFSGSAVIQYLVSDNLGTASSPGTITVLVNFVNSAPVANPDNATTTEDQAVTFNIIANDTDDGTINGATVDLNTAVAGVQNTITVTGGKFDVNGSGVVKFTPALHFNGPATASYTVNDNIGSTSNEAVITVTVDPVNDAPVAANDNANTNEDLAVTIKILDNDTDVDGTLDPSSVDLNTSTADVESTHTTTQGTFQVNTSSGIVTYTPAANFNGTATLTYNVKDNLGLKSGNATISIAVENINDAPSFNEINNQVVLRNSATKAVQLTGISAGVQETEQILITAQSDNTTIIPHPTVVYNGSASTASLTFKPQLNQSGTVTITVKAVDSGLTEFTRTFTITVIDARIISTPKLTAVNGEVYEYTIETTEIDPEDFVMSLVATKKPTWATLSTVTTTPSGKHSATLLGTPAVNAPASSAVTIQLKHGATVVDEQQFTIVLNQRPVAGEIEFEINEDVGTVLPLEKFVEAFTDPDAGDELTTIVFTDSPEHGELRLNNIALTPDQIIPASEIVNVTFFPELNFNGEDFFAYKAGDGHHISASAAQIKVVIQPVNDPPSITFIEPEPFEFDIGRELAQIFTPGFTGVDVDEDELVRAEIGFRRPNFDELHDVLEFTNTSKIKGEYDSRIGILTLTGKATAAEYSEAIQSIKYNFIDIEYVNNLNTIKSLDRTIYVKLHDEVSASEEQERIINLEYNFIPLDIPNVFTPDAIGNRIWKIREKGDTDKPLSQYEDAVVMVFSKRGQVVFETVGFEKTFDGTFQGKALPVDTYFYVIDLKYGKVQYKGTVTILRKAQ